MKKMILTTTALFACVALAGCSAGGNAPEPSKAVESTPADAQPTTPGSSGKSISINGETAGTTHLIEYKAYSRGGTGDTADASVRWTTKKLPKFSDFSEEWEQTMAFQRGERASVLVMSTKDVSVGCELYVDGHLVDSQGLDTEEYKVECVSDIR